MSHPLLARQLRKLKLDETQPPSAEAWQALLARIDRTYVEADQERYLRIRSQTLAERELQELSQSLAVARDQALASASVKSDFLANISHEIRTPLNGVIGLATLLMETPLVDDQRDLAQSIRSSGEALVAIVNDVLDLSKLEAGKIDLESVELCPRTIAEEVGDIVGNKAHEGGLELVIDVAHDVPLTVHGDPTRLRQVLLNLVNNAIKFTPQGEVLVQVWVEHRPARSTAQLRFEVRDTGVGIPADRTSRLFQAFSQLDASTTRKYGGTGLGLAICKQLVEAMGGQIGVESVEGQGSTFWFRVDLPVVAESKREREQLAGARVVVLDEHSASSTHLRRLMAGWQCQTTFTERAAEALEIMGRSPPPDILLVVEAVDSIEVDALTCALQATPHARATKIVLATLPARIREHANADGLPCAAVIAKPLKRDQVHRTLAKVIGRPVSSGPKRSSLTKLSPGAMGRRVLVVDDNRINQRVTGRLLQLAGYVFEVADNGQEALDRLAAGRFDAVLMDCQMPVMDGFQATRELRRREAQGPRTPVIALTAGALSTDRDACLAAEMDAFLTKPVRPNELLAVLDQIITPTESRP